MSRRMLTIATGALAVVLVIGGLASSRSVPPVRLESSVLAPGGRTDLLPHAVLPPLVHQCGPVDPADFFEHEFPIANAGQSPLTFERAQIGHVNLTVDLPEQPIPPGQQGIVRLRSRPLKGEKELLHSVDLASNDPQHAAFTLALAGTVSARVAAQPPRIVLSRSADGQSLRGQAIVYSQRWPALAVSRVQCSVAGPRWTIEPASPSDLPPLGALCGYKVELVVPVGTVSGPFYEALSLRAGPTGDDAAQREFILYANDSGEYPISITGGDDFNGNTLSLGAHPVGSRIEGDVLIKIRDPHRDVKVLKTTTLPNLLRASLEPCGPDGRRRGLYKLRVAVPADTPACDYMGYRMGEVRLEIDHPSVPLLLLRVEFALLPAGRVAMTDF